MNFQTSETQVSFTVKCPTQFGQAVYISGSCNKLGNWNPQQAIRMNWSEDNWWYVVSLPTDVSFEYKYFVANYEQVTNDVCWEQTTNRSYSFQDSQTQETDDVFNSRMVQTESCTQDPHIETETFQQTQCLEPTQETPHQQLSWKQESFDRLEVQRNDQERSSVMSSSTCNSDKSLSSPEKNEVPSRGQQTSQPSQCLDATYHNLQTDAKVSQNTALVNEF
ncbi:hypothetical protein ABPG72_007126 [Tetrahymena utriculariae]